MRIFIGTEPRQRRAERVLEYSIRSQTTEPIEIIWMRHGDPGWTVDLWPLDTYTKFTNFRCMVPHLLQDGEIGIYLDVDVLLLGDISDMLALGRPNEWVTDSFGHTSVSVISSGLRDFPDVQTVRNTRLSRLDWPKYQTKDMDRWQCRGTREPGDKLIHFTDMRLQPWKPCPDDFSYDILHPNSDLWFNCELEMIRA